MGIYIFVSILIIIACILQVLIVLVQNSKGGGLAAGFTGTGQTMGVRKTADFLEKSTWTLAGVILVLSLVATASIPREEKLSRSQELRHRFRTRPIRMQYRFFQVRFPKLSNIDSATG
jgi:preprotein translocase subunit SecG